MRKGFVPLLCALCIGLYACTAAQQSPGEEGSFPDSAELSDTAAPEQEGSELPYDLYRDCRPAEDVFHIEKIDLPQNPEGQVFSPVAFLGENTLLGSLYEAADGVPSDQGAAALGRLDLQTGEWQKLISPPDGATDVILTFSDSYIVYWEMPLSDAEAPTSGKASLCIYDRRAEEAYALFEYPEEFLKSALVYGNHIVLVEDRLYFDTVVPRIEGTKTLVYSATCPHAASRLIRKTHSIPCTTEKSCGLSQTREIPVCWKLKTGPNSSHCRTPPPKLPWVKRSSAN